ITLLLSVLSACSNPETSAEKSAPLPGMLFRTRTGEGEAIRGKWWLQGADGKAPILLSEDTVSHYALEPIVSHNLSYALYEEGQDLWLYDLITQNKQNITHTPDCDESFSSWSPDDRTIAYFGCGFDQRDLWLFDLETGEKRNITNTPERFEYCNFTVDDCTVGWLSDSVVFFSWDKKEGENDPINKAIFLTRVNKDGTGYEIIGAENTSGNFSISPDMQKIAVGFGLVYDLKTEQYEKISPPEFGLDLSKNAGLDAELVNPSWSPDGKKIVWQIVRISIGYEVGYALFDLEAKTAKLVMTYTPYYNNLMSASPLYTWPATPVKWSADSRWFAFSTRELLEPDSGGNFVYVFNRDGESVMRFADGYHPFWEDTGQHLAFSHSGKTNSIDLVSAGRWDIVSQIDTQSEPAFLEDWVHK
ncbi:MAG TPA: hypothetical protein VFF78_00565, partial [Anaerolineaceae bacterium]|nr:hypothetical protein [Anaerolineaceae bacterium]